MLDLHGLPHRFSDAGPRRIDDVARRRACDEDAREIEQQRRVLVTARIQSCQRIEEVVSAQIRIAYQVERRIGRDVAVAGVRLQEMRGTVLDRRVDISDGGEGGLACQSLRFRMFRFE